MKVINQRTELVPIDSIQPHPRNPHMGDVGAIAESIDHTGFYGALIVQEGSNRILVGNHRWMAARHAGAAQIPATFVDVDDEAALRILLADNRLSRLASDDSNALAVLLQELAATPTGLAGSGYDGDALDELLADLGAQQPELRGDPDAVPEVPEEPVTKAGEIITLGRHRLMCGDSAVPADVNALLAGMTPQFLWADPPYGADLDTDFSTMGGRNSMTQRSGNRYARVRGDSAPYDPAPLMARLASCPEQFWWGADYYAERIPQRTQGAWVVWDKRLDESRDRMFGSCFELCWSKAHHKREIARVAWAGIFGMAGEPERERLHPTQKPVALLEWFLGRYGEGADVVADFYGGAGSCLLACESTGRQCLMMEIEPAYCDVICQRFKDMTGIDPVREPAPAPAEASDHARVGSG